MDFGVLNGINAEWRIDFEFEIVIVMKLAFKLISASTNF